MTFVAVTIKKNGILKKMISKSKSYNNCLFFTEDFISGKEEKAIDEYCLSCDRSYKEIAEYNHEFLAPIGDGLVFIDYDKREIHNFQLNDTPAMYSIMDLITNTKHENIALAMNLVNMKKKLILNNSINVISKLTNKEESLTDYFETTDTTKILNKIEKHLENPNGEKSKLLSDLIENSKFGFKNTVKSLFSSKSDEEKMREIFEYQKQDKFFNLKFKLKSLNVINYPINLEGYFNLFNIIRYELNEQDIEVWKKYAMSFFEDYSDKNLEKMDEDGLSNIEKNMYVLNVMNQYLNKFKYPTKLKLPKK